MISRLVLDSSILVEYINERRIDLLDKLLATPELVLHVNSTVLSEATFYWLALHGEKSPRSVQQSRNIGSILNAQNPLGFLSQFTVLPSNDRIVPIYLDLMQRYNLLPNDALILASAKLHNIPAVASYDSDFEPACTGEGIRLVRDVADLV